MSYDRPDQVKSTAQAPDGLAAQYLELTAPPARDGRATTPASTDKDLKPMSIVEQADIPFRYIEAFDPRNAGRAPAHSKHFAELTQAHKDFEAEQESKKTALTAGLKPTERVSQTIADKTAGKSEKSEKTEKSSDKTADRSSHIPVEQQADVYRWIIAAGKSNHKPASEVTAKPGDTYWGLAKSSIRAHGVDQSSVPHVHAVVKKMAQLNNKTETQANSIKPGDVIKMPFL